MKPFTPERLDAVAKSLVPFVLAIAEEGERGAVILCVSRLDNALEALLKSVFLHHPGGSDNLLDSDRPLGTFSSRIAVCYRLGLIDREVEHCLQLFRRIRNDFAHSVGVASLSESAHKSRLAEIRRLMQPHYELYKSYEEAYVKISNESLRDFCIWVTFTLGLLEAHTLICEPLELGFTISFAGRSKAPIKTPEPSS